MLSGIGEKIKNILDDAKLGDLAKCQVSGTRIITHCKSRQFGKI